MLCGWMLTLWLAGGYSRDVFGAGTDEYRRVLNASLLAAGLVGVGSYLAKFQLSRGFFLLVFAIGIPALILGRFALRRALYSARMHGALMLRVVIAGTPSHVDEVARVLRRETWLGYRVVGALVPDSSAEETLTGVPVLGRPEQILNAIEVAEADVIFLAGGALDSAGQLRRLAWQLEDRDVQVIVAPSVTDVSAERIRVRPVGGLPLMHLDKPRAVHASRAGKRLFDLAGSTALLALFAPLMAVAALWVKLYDGGPVFFAQVRTGRDGTSFRCLKFRSMVVDAEARLEALHAETGYSHTDGGLFKLESDPRITAPGRWLRRFSLDELPQLVNVLRGEMSLVGPRPPLPAEVAAYASDTTRRLRVRPGMTGLWQVSGRADLSFDEAIRLDLFYVDNWSMLQDLAILVRTLGAVIGSRGAY
jgi:exopolysaccharide biosynthesis polyprenyl glycosylphosphotransferase